MKSPVWAFETLQRKKYQHNLLYFNHYEKQIKIY